MVDKDFSFDDEEHLEARRVLKWAKLHQLDDDDNEDCIVGTTRKKTHRKRTLKKAYSYFVSGPTEALTNDDKKKMKVGVTLNISYFFGNLSFLWHYKCLY